MFRTVGLYQPVVYNGLFQPFWGREIQAGRGLVPKAVPTVAPYKRIAAAEERLATLQEPWK